MRYIFSVEYNRTEPNVEHTPDNSARKKCTEQKLRADNVFKRQRQHSRKRRTANARFGATEAGSADLKGSAGMPPLRQAAIPLAVSAESVVEKAVRFEKRLQPEKVERMTKRNVN